MSRRRGQGAVRWVLLTALVLAIVAGGFALSNYLRPVVTVTEVVRAPVVQAFYATGTLSPVREHPVKASVSGTVERISAEPFIDKGSRVTKGQPLLKVVEPELEFLASRALAELEEKRALADEKSSPVLAEF